MYQRMIATALGLTLSFAAGASPSHPLIWCNGCSPEQIKSIALSKAGGKGHQIWVGDQRANQIHQFAIFYVQEDPSHCSAGSASCGHIEAFEQPVSDQVREAFSASTAQHYRAQGESRPDGFFEVLDAGGNTPAAVSP